VSAAALSTGAALGGGGSNSVATSATDAFLGGGTQNQIDASSVYAAISGGQNNVIEANAGLAFIGGGQNNVTYSGWSVIGGRNGNDVGSGTLGSTIGGGYNNTNNGNYATVPGGQDNLASGEYSFAAGEQAQALHQGAFVWADSTATALPSTNNNSVTMRASGGYRLYSSTSTGVYLAAGSGAWNNLSDRNAKNNLAPVNPQAVLAEVATLPISQWSYKTEQGVRHLGPMAQDFHRAFAVGENDTTICTVDEEGVALAAIQGLNQKLEAETKEKDAEIEILKAKADKVDSLEIQLNELKHTVQLLAERK
jgi:trimeric autotransporter adhesin